MTRKCFPVVWTCVIAVLSACAACAEDWPEVHGRGRRNEWNERGILRRFPPAGLTVRWRVPIGSGYSGPAVADGRVYVGDYKATAEGGIERVLCLDEQTGQVLWVFGNPRAAYNRFSYNSGPRATPTVDGDRVFMLGGAGDLYCLDSRTGELKWQWNLPADFEANMPTWGFSGAPVVWRNLVICPVGGRNNARIVAFDRTSGDVIWRVLPPTWDIGYSPPIVISSGGVEQLIHWHGGAVVSLNPQTGDVYWEQPFSGNLPVATPLAVDDLLFVSAFFDGPLMLKLAGQGTGAQVLWQGKSRSEINTDGLHALMCTPVFKDGFIYGVCSYGQLRCLNAQTGERVWESLQAVGEMARWATAFLTRNHEVFFINNDRGELIIAELSPAGYHELDRTPLIRPTSGGAGNRATPLVNWTLPAYANRHILIRNDEEIIRASLEDLQTAH